MALAAYFTRTATAASQVLKGFEARHFESLLSDQVVGIALDDDACSSEGRASLDMLIRLVARFYPTLVFLPRGEDARKLARQLGRLARSINGQIDILPERGATLTSCLVVGRTAPGTTCPLFFLGSSGWIAKFSSKRAVGSGESGNPFGAGAAACIAVANLFRSIFAGQLPGATIDDNLAFSMFDYASGSRRNPTFPTEVVLDDAALLGLGAIGNGALWALSKVPDLRGSLQIVDQEDVDLGNLQRYVLTTERYVGKSKVLLAERELKGHPALVLKGVQQRWQHWGKEMAPHVLVALDTAADRIAVQGTLPRWTINSWTQRGDLGVSHHEFLGDRACLACLYLPDAVVQDLDDVIAEALGLQDRQQDFVRPMLHSNDPVDLEMASEIARRLGVPAEPLMPFVGKPLRTFYQEAICGGVVFELTGGKAPVRVEVPMAFQSAMAGIMLAAELVKRVQRGGPPDWTTAKIDMLRRMPSGSIGERRKKDRLGRCICQDHDYSDAYRSKHGLEVLDLNGGA